jgi:hypothetical protein
MVLAQDQTFPLSLTSGSYLECQKCSIVDRNKDRINSRNECPICGTVNEGGLLYFHVNILILLDLIQESFHSSKTENIEGRFYEGEGPNDISVVIFYCTLREALLDNLIVRLLKAHELKDGVKEGLLEDNKFHIQKQNKLFKSLTNAKWNDAIINLNEESKIDLKKVDEFTLEVVRARNDFIHEGRKWAIDRELSTNCINNVPRLISLYVKLHNNYVHPFYLKNL